MKKFLSILLGVALCVSLSACGNRDMFDTVYTYDKAIINLPNGQTIEGKVEQWRDYEDGDQIQVRIDGTTYLVHASCIVLIQEGD